MQRLEQIKRRYERVWLVSWAMNEADPRGVISTWLAENGSKATHQWYGSVQLSLVGFEAEAAATERLDAPLDNGIVLEGYRLPSRTLKAGETLALAPARSLIIGTMAAAVLWIGLAINHGLHASPLRHRGFFLLRREHRLDVGLPADDVRAKHRRELPPAPSRLGRAQRQEGRSRGDRW